MSVFEYCFLFLSVILGGGVAFFIHESKKIRLDLILSFSGAYILGITVLHLMPGIFSNPEGSIGLWVLGGFFIQLTLEQFSQGVEHGHIHAHKNAPFSFALAIMTGLCLHAFIEGLPLSVYAEFHQHSHGGAHSHNHLYYGVILHKAPAAFVLVLVLLRSSFNRATIAILLVVFASMSPLGAWLTKAVNIEISQVDKTLGLVVGSFLHISTTILFEADDTKEHKISWIKLFVIVLGTGLALLTMS